MSAGPSALHPPLTLPLNARTMATVLTGLLVSLGGLFLVAPAARPVVLPTLVVLNLFVLFVVTLKNRDGRLPVFELGTVCALITGLYATVPLVGFWLGGLTWSPLSDSRLYNFPPTGDQLVGVAWRYVVYFASFVLAYLWLRGRISFPAAGVGVDRTTQAVIVAAFLALGAFFLLVQIVFGVSLNTSYASVREGATSLPSELPRFIQQAVGYGEGVLLVSKLCLLVLLFRRWASPRSRVVLIGWLAFEVITAATRLGSRRDTAMLLIASVLLYDHLVRPLKTWQAVAGGASLLLGLLAFGFNRDLGGAEASWTAANEFQILFGNGCDMLARVRSGQLDIPRQLHFGELLMLIPSRWQPLLPFPVLDPSDWYLDVLDVRGTGVGFMFGVVAQAIIGGDWVELVTRGIVLGLCFAGIHRWCSRRADNLWVVVFYLYLCLWCYYTIRATTFYMTYFVLYRFVPAVALLWAVRNGDLLLVTEGYHPFAANQGYDAYYLNFLAGDRRTMQASDDPDIAWIRETWKTMERDPRVPLVTGAETPTRAGGS